MSAGLGTEVVSSNLTIPAGATVTVNTSTASLTYDAPPGTVIAAAAIANFTSTPAYVQPMRFRTDR